MRMSIFFFFRLTSVVFRKRNEENGCSWILDGCKNANMSSTYTPWLKLWYVAMKKGCPDCILSIGPLDYNDNGGYQNASQYLEVLDVFLLLPTS